MAHAQPIRIRYRRALLATAILEYPGKRTHFDHAVQIIKLLSSDQFKRLRHTMLRLSNPSPEHTQILEHLFLWLNELNFQDIPDVIPNAWDSVFIVSSEGDSALENVFSEYAGPWVIVQIAKPPELVQIAEQPEH
jgi:hypothetical protein